MSFIATKTSLNRRAFLKGTGATVALPFLSAMTPAFSKAAAAPKRFVAMNAGLGFHAPNFIPTETGAGYQSPLYLQKLEEHRKDFTVFSGLSHPNSNGSDGHTSELTWLTSAPHPGLAGFKNTISIDQLMAKHIGAATRFPSLSIGTNNKSLSWTANGVRIPSQSHPAKLFRQMFVNGTEKEVAEEMKNLERGRSILDTVLGDAKALNVTLGARDREKLDEYFTSVRELEIRLQQNKQWANRPKPKVNYREPQEVADRTDILAKQRLLYDLILLALQTDSTRVITFSLGSMNAVPNNIPGVRTDWHMLSHHGRDENKIEELARIEAAEFEVLNEFLTKLKNVKEAGGHLLDHTAVLFGSNLGNASSHSWHNLPILLAGGGYKHGHHAAHDPENNTPFANLFVPLAQRMGVEIDQFGSSTASTIQGLES
ncbi:MAG: hypothetical protein CMI26_01100 [Opitutae bacterium]|jgi:hypothetical protein|nr:hypothetical protein [Opitutae bacterium]|tara:strand:+ start:2755 stop:4038 length:1284 start_codon:yes stop_codon:yes gene_type:complete